jgi:hypothetical protein
MRTQTHMWKDYVSSSEGARQPYSQLTLDRVMVVEEFGISRTRESDKEILNDEYQLKNLNVVDEEKVFGVG